MKVCNYIKFVLPFILFQSMSVYAPKLYIDSVIDKFVRDELAKGRLSQKTIDSLIVKDDWNKFAYHSSKHTLYVPKRFDDLIAWSGSLQHEAGHIHNKGSEKSIQAGVTSLLIYTTYSVVGYAFNKLPKFSKAYASGLCLLSSPIIGFIISVPIGSKINEYRADSYAIKTIKSRYIRKEKVIKKEQKFYYKHHQTTRLNTPLYLRKIMDNYPILYEFHPYYFQHPNSLWRSWRYKKALEELRMNK